MNKPFIGWPAAASLALVMVLAGCSNAPVVGPGPGAALYRVASVPSTLSSEEAGDVTLYAVGLVGTPYRYGGNTPDTGFDCSGLIGHVYQSRSGVVPPRTVSRLQYWGTAISGEQVRSGDVVLFAQSGEPTHAGIYVGEGRFVHAPSTGGEVRLDRLNARYWAAQNVSFRRP